MQEEVADYDNYDQEMSAELYDGENLGDEVDVEDMKRKVQEMESEHEKLTQMQQSVDKQLTSAEQTIDENSM